MVKMTLLKQCLYNSIILLKEYLHCIKAINLYPHYNTDFKKKLSIAIDNEIKNRYSIHLSE